MGVAQIRAEDGMFQKCTCQPMVESAEIGTHLSIKFLKDDFGTMLWLKSLRRTLVLGLIYGLRANKQFDKAF